METVAGLKSVVKQGDQRPAFDTLCGNEIRTLLGSNL